MVEHAPVRYLLRARDEIDRRYADPLTVADLAAVAGSSVAHFSREFRKAFGETPHQYLLTRRLERSSMLLRMTDRTVADICCMVGLTSVGSFTTSFRRVYGLTPTAYRRQHPAPIAPIPACYVRAYGRRQNRSFREDAATPRV